jgi:NTP pyrophosphatase (non-canonical NTP hydrolase)
MNLEQLSERALVVHKKYAESNIEKFGREWTNSELAQGFVGDVGDLMKLVMAKEGIREIENVDQKLAHELSDCLWSILVIAHKFDINLEKSFIQTMSELEVRFKQ